MLAGMDPVVVTHNAAAHRFETVLGDEVAFVHYRLEGGRIVFTHTEVPAAFAGRGVGGQLAKAALEYAKAEALPVVPRCPFVAAYIKKHPEYQTLVAPDA
jgi:predicted GNAT family acetyltransferase